MATRTVNLVPAATCPTVLHAPRHHGWGLPSKPPLPPSAPRGVSLVIPAYNEERRLGATLESYLPALEGLNVPFEVLVMSSGSDGTPRIADGYAPRGVRVSHASTRMGKGRAILEGFRRARYGTVAYADADGSVPPLDVERLLQMALHGERAIVASRRLEPGTVWVRAPLPKFWASNIWHALVRLLLDLPLRDSECGFKVFTKTLTDRITREVTVTNWIFDVTMLFHVRASGEAIREVPVNYNYHHDSRMRLFRTAPVMAVGLLAVFLVDRLHFSRALPMRFLRVMNRRFAAD